MVVQIIAKSIELVKLTNGKKFIERRKVDYETNLKHFTMRGFKLVSDKVKEVKSDIKENVVKLKPKKKGKKK